MIADENLSNEYKFNAVKACIKCGAEIVARDNKGNTPLIWVSQKCNKEIAELLISEGADINAKGKNCMTVLMMFIRKFIYWF